MTHSKTNTNGALGPRIPQRKIDKYRWDKNYGLESFESDHVSTRETEIHVRDMSQPAAQIVVKSAGFEL